jgi:hypothetical protein
MLQTIARVNSIPLLLSEENSNDMSPDLIDTVQQLLEEVKRA